MNIGRGALLILVGWLLGSMSVFAEKRLRDSTYEDWTAVVNELVLTDGSVLFDYTARTFSGRTEGAMLAMSFVPRFSCAPTFNLRTRAGAASVNDLAVLEIVVDSERMQFDALVDSDEDYLMYAIAASLTELEQLRKKIDVASRASFRVLTDAESLAGNPEDSPSPNETDTIVFSLLGSRLATLAAEEHCRSHEPLAYSPQ